MSNNKAQNDEPKVIQYGFGNDVNVTIEFLTDTAITLEIKCYTQYGDVIRITTQKVKADTRPYAPNLESEDIQIES